MSIDKRKFEDEDIKSVHTSDDGNWVHFSFDPDLMPSDCIGLTKGDVRALAKHFNLLK